ncbi:Cyclic nucleotide-gated cation channel beta-1, partial [Ophiophagus hannah]
MQRVPVFLSLTTTLCRRLGLSEQKRVCVCVCVCVFLSPGLVQPLNLTGSEAAHNANAGVRRLLDTAEGKENLQAKCLSWGGEEEEGEEEEEEGGGGGKQYHPYIWNEGREGGREEKREGKGGRKGKRGGGRKERGRKERGREGIVMMVFLVSSDMKTEGYAVPKHCTLSPR